MPGVMLLREQLIGEQPLEGARILGCTHITAQAAGEIQMQSSVLCSNFSSHRDTHCARSDGALVRM